MPDLTLMFDLHQLTDEAGKPIIRGGEEVFVPVLTKAEISGSEPLPDKAPKAYHTADGWAKPDPKQGTKYVYPVECDPEKWEHRMRNDLLYDSKKIP